MTRFARFSSPEPKHENKDEHEHEHEHKEDETKIAVEKKEVQVPQTMNPMFHYEEQFEYLYKTKVILNIIVSIIIIIFFLVLMVILPYSLLRPRRVIYQKIK